MDRDLYNLVIFLDLQKTFDTVNPVLLLGTLGTEDSKCCRENRFENGGMIFTLGGWGSKYFVCNEI